MNPISVPNPYEKCIIKYVKKREIQLIGEKLFLEVNFKENNILNVKYIIITKSIKLF
jgi:hypothetical protein